MASQNGHTHVVNILLASGADVNLTGFKVIMDGNCGNVASAQKTALYDSDQNILRQRTIYRNAWGNE